MNYKNIVGLLMLMLSHAVYTTGTVTNEDALRSAASTRISGTAIQNALCEMLSTLEDMKRTDDLCKATVITQAQVLSESGIYCLGNDVTGTIFIAGSGITLNLNGYTIFAGSDGIAVSDTASDVRIKNGFIQGTSVDRLSEDRGIFISGARDVRIADVTCQNWAIGIYFVDATAGTLDRVVCDRNRVGFLCEQSLGLVIRNSVFSDNVLRGAQSSSCSSVEFINCSAFHSSGADSEVIGFSSNGATIVYRDCTAFNLGLGFIVDFGRGDFFNCVSNGNIIGFEVDGDAATVNNCVAQDNIGSGFFSVPDQGEVVFRNCLAKGNGIGFGEVGAITDDIKNMYLNCIACNNGTNYSSNIIASNHAPVTSAANARGFDNVDCSNMTPDLLAAAIQLLVGTVPTDFIP
ncbi:MAG TPA: right-handed parallel beta-helix repeat-containing protein [Candidatus Babeliales bacterium]|nr:right-handed parallel beta-helix repeat-containing protein [Candidatus Babeliales bacterium]